MTAAIREIWAITLPPAQIRITIAEPHYAAHFSSAIAIAIAPQLRLDPVIIAEQVVQFCQNQTDAEARGWQMRAVGKGWLNLILEEVFILEALQQLALWQPEHLIKQGNFWRRNDLGANSILQPVTEYAYARCCALIRLAQKENLDFWASSSIQEPFVLYDYVDIAELELCIEILAIADELFVKHLTDYPEPQKIPPLQHRKLKTKLSTKFLRFYDRCRILGVSPATARRRLLLITITQKLFLAIAPVAVDYAEYL